MKERGNGTVGRGDSAADRYTDGSPVRSDARVWKVMAKAVLIQ